MMLPAVGALKVTSGCPLAEQSTDKRHDNGSGSKINVVLLNNATKIVQAEHKNKYYLIFVEALPAWMLLTARARRCIHGCAAAVADHLHHADETCPRQRGMTAHASF